MFDGDPQTPALPPKGEARGSAYRLLLRHAGTGCRVQRLVHVTFTNAQLGPRAE